MATLETILVKRKCNLQGRTGDFALVRKNVKQSIVRAIDANGQLGQEENVDTPLVTNERKYEAPKAPKEDKEYPADRPERKVCLLKDREGKRYHLLRQSADFSKVLEVGTAGKGEWVANSVIADKFAVPNANRPRYIPRQPIRVCQVVGREGKFLLLRQTSKGSRVIPILGENYGETIDNSLVTGATKILLKRKKDGTQEVTTETDGAKTDDDTQATVVDSSPPVADTAPVAQPVQAAPVAQPVQAAPVAQPAQAAQPQRMQPVARPQQVPQRPAPVR